MKFLIFSDIHGSAAAAERLNELVSIYDPDRILLLGDLLYHGPRNDLPSGYAPKKVIPVLNGLSGKIMAVRGNCEAEVDQMVLSFPCMSTYSELYADVLKLTLTHGHIYNEEAPVPGASVMLYGHTHIPVCHEKNGVFFFNPGSTSIPKGGFKPSFGLLEDRVFSVLDLESREVMMTSRL